MGKRFGLLLWFAMISGCRNQDGQPFAPLVQEFVNTTLSFSPVAATTVGYHEHAGVPLDQLLDDYSAQGIERQRGFYAAFRSRLERIRLERLNPQDRADFELMQDQISLALLELDTIQSYRHNPTLYVETIGSALFSPHVLEYAPKSERFRHIVARLKRVPAFLEHAKRNLESAPVLWTQVAQEENEGNIALIDGALRKAAPKEWSSAYDQAAAPAMEALRSFNDFLRKELEFRPAEWRLGRDKYAQKFRYVLATDRTPQQVLEAAEADLKRVREQMLALSKSLGQSGSELNQVVSRTLDRIAGRHATPDSYFSDARRDLEEARRFVKEKELLPLPSRDNLQVIETPEFMRGIYSVGGFSPAPALEPKLGAFYWLTPIPKDWPRQRVESKLREYNYYGLKLLTIHEAMPGHYVQFEYANDIQPPSRRLLRGVFGNGPYIEGWAVYATELMLDAGYLDNSPELRLTFQKQQLRMLANAILDIRLHTMGMTDQEAMDLMIRDTFQEREEATGKLRRAKLSTCQLPTYYVGWRDWVRLREQYQQSKGGEFSQSEFHQRALEAGALPLPVLARFLTGKEPGN